ncbi:unnamed protein product [Arctogadus glacialis]
MWRDMGGEASIKPNECREGDWGHPRRCWEAVEVVLVEVVEEEGEEVLEEVEEEEEELGEEEELVEGEADRSSAIAQPLCEEARSASLSVCGAERGSSDFSPLHYWYFMVTGAEANVESSPTVFQHSVCLMDRLWVFLQGSVLQLFDRPLAYLSFLFVFGNFLRISFSPDARTVIKAEDVCDPPLSTPDALVSVLKLAGERREVGRLEEKAGRDLGLGYGPRLENNSALSPRG